MRKLLPIFISAIVINSNMLCANATENILSGVNVKLNDEISRIELTTLEPAKVKKNILSADRVILNVENVSLSKNAFTKFNDHNSFDKVIIEPNSNSGTDILIQGDNVAYSNIEFKSPGALKTAEESIISSFNSLFNLIKGSSLKSHSVQFGLLVLFLAMLLAEVRFIKSKYDELREEKEKMMKDIELTSDFSTYLPGYGRSGLNKPYTTPVYSTNIIANTNVHSKLNIGTLRTPETITLNSLLYNRNKENKIIDRIINNPPVFGSLSVETNDKKVVTNPVEKSKIQQNISHLEQLTAKMKENAEPSLSKRLNTIY